MDINNIINVKKNSVYLKKMAEKANDLEAVFISNMLSYTRLGEENSSMGGGIGAQQFSSFLRDEYAKRIVTSGGIGLAEKIFQSFMSLKGSKGE